MDVLVRTQATADINLIVPLMINTGAPDTGATVTCKAINPDGTENTSFTAPTISEAVATTGVYKLIFPAAAANKLFTLANENNPYTVLVKSATSGSTGYRAIRVYCTDRLPGTYALSTEIASLDTLIDGALVTIDALPTLAEIEATTVLAKDATVAKAATVALDSTVAKDATVAKDSTVAKAATVALDATVAKAATVTSEIAAVQSVVDAIPTLAEMEGSTILAKEASSLFLKKCIKNKKKILVIAGVLYLIIYDDDDTTEILRKAIKDFAGADVANPAAGVIAFETKTTV